MLAPIGTGTIHALLPAGGRANRGTRDGDRDGNGTGHGDGRATRATEPLATGSTRVRIGQLNVKNLFDTVDEPRRQDTVVTAATLESQLGKLALTLRDTMGAPDVVALQEVENIGVLRQLAAHPLLAELGYEGELLVVAGDLNESPTGPAYGLLTHSPEHGARLVSVADLLPAEERYSYRRGRQRHLLDHLLLPAGSAAAIMGASIPHVNTGAAGKEARDGRVPGGASDHDPVVAELELVAR